MVLHDDILYLLGKAVILRKRKPVGRMGDQDGRGNKGIGHLVRVLAKLVFLEIDRTFHLTDIVEIRADAGKQRIGADGFGRAFSQIGDDNGMMVGAGRLQQKPAQQRMVGVGQFQQLAGCGKLK